VRHRGRSDRLVVTFDWRLDGRDGFSPDDHSTHFARQGFSQLSVKTRANDWFVNPETPALEAALERIAGEHARVHALGFSMGGFGALRFARALRLSRVVVVSPQSSPLAPWDGRYRAEAPDWDEAGGDLAPRAAPRLRGLLVLDPFVPEDSRHARAILALFPGLRRVPLSFGGHPAIRTLRGAGGMRVVQEQAGVLAPGAGPILAAHRAARRASPGYWLRLAARAGPRRPRLAAEARLRASRLPPVAGDA
jgi:hypothetical protein